MPCRYKCHVYKLRYACFDCRKAFKPMLWTDLPEKARRVIAPSDGRICPDCGKQLHHVGHDFKAPPKQNIRKWKLAERLHQLGVRYTTCGCYDPGLVPVKENELNAFSNDRVRRSSGEKLLIQFAARDADRQRNSRYRPHAIAQKLSGRVWGTARPSDARKHMDPPPWQTAPPQFKKTN